MLHQGSLNRWKITNNISKNYKLLLNLQLNRNIQHFQKTLVKIAKNQQSNTDSMHFDHEANVIFPSEAGTNKF